jgi:hypothetical protein
LKGSEDVQNVRMQRVNEEEYQEGQEEQGQEEEITNGFSIADFRF